MAVDPKIFFIFRALAAHVNFRVSDPNSGGPSSGDGEKSRRDAIIGVVRPLTGPSPGHESTATSQILASGVSRDSKNVKNIINSKKSGN